MNGCAKDSTRTHSDGRGREAEVETEMDACCMYDMDVSAWARPSADKLCLPQEMEPLLAKQKRKVDETGMSAARPYIREGS